MKRILALILCLTLFLLPACAQKSEGQVTLPPTVPIVATESTTEALPETMTAMAAVSVPLTTDHFTLDDGTELFSYSYQHMNLIFPDAAVADKVTLEFLNRVDTTNAESENILNMAKADCIENDQWIPYFYRVIYNPKRIDLGVMSLFGMQNSYSGGMHGNISCIAANYDMTTGDVLTFGSIMHENAQKEDFIEIVISYLKEHAEEYYLYEDFETAVRQRLSGDENQYEDFFFTTTGLNFFFSPYEIAPYSSGIITVEIPYSDLPGMIYDGYFPPERQIIDGTIKTGLFSETDMEKFNNMAEIILPDSEELHVLYPSGPVENIAVTVLGDKKTLPDYTVFMAFEMADKDAVVLHLPVSQTDKISINYQSSGSIHELSLTQ